MMVNSRRYLATALVLCASVAAEWTALAQTGAVTTVILVRHAERESGQGDDPLSAQGRERAQALARLLRDTGVTTVMTSGLTRTRQTAEPLASQSGLTPEVLPSDKLDAVVERIRSLGGTVLIVHHSNTVPLIAEKLGAKIAPIEDKEFDRLIVMTIPASGSPSVVTLRYGPPSAR